VNVDRYIASCASWGEFYRRTRELSEVDKGRAFERLVQLYLQTAPDYRTKLRDVWLAREVPADVRRAINLPLRDEGVDLIARTRDGEFWAIQAKCYYQDGAISRRALGTFIALTSNYMRDVSLRVVAHVSPVPISKSELYRDTVQIGLDRFRAADWSLIVRRAKKKSDAALPKASKPFPHQKRAIARAKGHFLLAKAARGRMIMPCGTGKSLAAFWIAQALKAKTIAIAVPNLGLVAQGVRMWTQELLALGQKPDWLCVCSDDSDFNNDEFIRTVYDTGLPALTDPKKIAKKLRESSKLKIVFTTYQSSDRLAEAARRARMKFDLVIFDEAHRTAGLRSKTFATLLHDRELKARRRLFMTATERTIMNGEDDVFSMDDNEEDYGKRFFGMSFKEAIEQKLICDYKILTVSVTEPEIRKLIAKNRLLNLSRKLDEAEARRVATGIAVKRAVKKYGIRRGFTFCATILGSKRFREQQDILAPNMANFHVSSEMSALERDNALDEFGASKKPAMMSNARCLSEGIDVPEVDCVVFADPKQSRVDIVQSTGRAMRRAKGKKFGYIMVPIVVPDGADIDEYAASTAFASVMQVLRALSVYDKRIVEELSTLQYGRVPRRGKIIKFIGRVPIGLKMPLAKFERAIKLKMWEKVARLNWRPFEEARAYVRTLGLKNAVEWFAYCRSGKKPNDIPTLPSDVYADAGWIGMSDWLGTYIHRRGNWRSFEEARALVQTLELKSTEEWHAYCRSGKKPLDIPRSPWHVYADAGWVSFSDWLGHKDWRPFKEARAFARTLGFKSSTKWLAYCRSKKKPNDIPKSPATVYAKAGWTDWGDWLGYESRYHGEWRPFEKARAFVRKLKLKSGTEWKAYCRSGKKPDDIPAFPEGVYADAGWIGMSDWLGSGRFHGNWRPFKKARALVRSLGLKNQEEWNTYSRSGKKPIDIPRAPWQVYADDGWIDLVDWLGAGRRIGNWRPFNEARAFVRSLGLKSYKEWHAYSESGKKPDDIPNAPDRVYADAWISRADWLGSQHRRGGWRSFKEARAFVHKLKLKNATRDWRAYCKSGKKPDDIPANPPAIYADAGWDGWGDWLGNGERRRGQWRDFKDARAFVRALGLESSTEWDVYCKSGKKPDDIPTSPNSVYADDGWTSVADWLGSKRRIGGWRSFKEARAFARSLGLKSSDEWRVFCKSKKRPDDIPSHPDGRYANAGWRGWNDWLGKPEMLPFKKARAFVRTLGLKNSEEWASYCKSGKKPANIPNTPYQHYADKGWVGWSDWLGNEWRPFNKARAFARSLGLKTGSEWWTYCKSGKAPKDIPLIPKSVYAQAGWAGWNDWLGSRRKMLPFKKARAFVRTLGLKKMKEWQTWSKSRKSPINIPSGPNVIYAGKGWVSWPNWLGCETPQGQNPLLIRSPSKMLGRLHAPSSSKIAHNGWPTASPGKSRPTPARPTPVPVG
jgi:superfamily II DNA or RNA helicase